MTIRSGTNLLDVDSDLWDEITPGEAICIETKRQKLPIDGQEDDNVKAKTKDDLIECEAYRFGCTNDIRKLWYATGVTYVEGKGKNQIAAHISLKTKTKLPGQKGVGNKNKRKKPTAVSRDTAKHLSADILNAINKTV